MYLHLLNESILTVLFTINLLIVSVRSEVSLIYQLYQLLREQYNLCSKPTIPGHLLDADCKVRVYTTFAKSSSYVSLLKSANLILTLVPNQSYSFISQALFTQALILPSNQHTLWYASSLLLSTFRIRVPRLLLNHYRQAFKVHLFLLTVGP